ncbi:uncharacterized protein LOC113378144 [Ctenocephalides felis]|uniref:uncharacterized protein LOC113378144 n=1 Tax=Ctenocephalides felis TaxID=7515 RepID=UPI000E6E25BB|nr:uncharacterized protein LOC113378144 [Ctenocephalides felis]
MDFYSFMAKHEKEIDIDDVNDEINALLQRKNNSQFISENLKCDEENLTENLITLDEELLIFGINSMSLQCSKNPAVSLCNVMWELITLYRNLESKKKKIENDNQEILKQNEVLQKLNNKFKRELQISNTEISALQMNCNKLKSKLESDNKEKTKLKY